jgi:hypothetical protein
MSDSKNLGKRAREYVRYLERAQHYAIRGLDFSGRAQLGRRIALARESRMSSRGV